MTKSRFLKRREMSNDMVLQITSMADIFTIILVFLLKSFSTGVSTISPSKNIVLPEAVVMDPIADTMKLEVSESAILIDDKPVVRLEGYQFGVEEFESDGTSKTLSHAFRQAVQDEHQKNTLRKVSGLLVLADQRTPFSTMKRVLSSASLAGINEYKLVVAEGQ